MLHLILAGVVVGGLPDSVRAVRPMSTLELLEAYNPQLGAAHSAAWSFKLRSLLSNEYTFFRGTADLFYRWCGDNAGDWLSSTALHVTLHGDLHLGNVGTYRTAGTGRPEVRFGVVDLDESIRGPFQLDLLRAATALRFAAAESGRSHDDTSVADAIRKMSHAYGTAIAARSGDADVIASCARVQRLVGKAAKESPADYLGKYTSDAARKFRRVRVTKKGHAEDLMQPVNGAMREALIDALWYYMTEGTTEVTRDRFRFSSRTELADATLDVAEWMRLDSSGSQGLRKYLFLLDRPLRDEHDALILQMKEEPVPAAARSGVLSAQVGADRAREVAEGYALLLDPPKWLIGHTTMDGRGFLVKTKDPWGKELSSEDVEKPEDLQAVAGALGSIIGRAHRTALLATSQEVRIPNIAAGADALADQLVDRSGRVVAFLRGHSRNLRADPRAVELAAQAESVIKALESEHTGGGSN